MTVVAWLLAGSGAFIGFPILVGKYLNWRNP